jgi:hypothetical protein
VEPENSRGAPGLYTHEWMALIVIIAAMGALTWISQIKWLTSSKEESIPHYLVDQEITLLVEGHLENPGTFLLTRGAKMKDLVALLKLLPDTDLSKLNLEAKLRNGQVVKIRALKAPRKKKITDKQIL